MFLLFLLSPSPSLSNSIFFLKYLSLFYKIQHIKTTPEVHNVYCFILFFFNSFLSFSLSVMKLTMFWTMNVCDYLIKLFVEHTFRERKHKEMFKCFKCLVNGRFTCWADRAISTNESNRKIERADSERERDGLLIYWTRQ